MQETNLSMERTIDKVGKYIQENVGKDVNMLIITSDSGESGMALKGDPNELAKALFLCMVKEENDVANNAFFMLRLVIRNLLKNKTRLTETLAEQLAQDVMEYINNKYPDEEEAKIIEDDRPSHLKLHIPGQDD